MSQVLSLSGRAWVHLVALMWGTRSLIRRHRRPTDAHKRTSDNRLCQKVSHIAKKRRWYVARRYCGGPVPVADAFGPCPPKRGRVADRGVAHWLEEDRAGQDDDF